MPCGTAGAPAVVMSPQPPSWIPPTGLAGRGIGAGAVWPGCGTSERSITGGGAVANGQASVLGVASGGAGGAGCVSAGWAPAVSVEASANARVAPMAASRANGRARLFTGTR